MKKTLACFVALVLVAAAGFAGGNKDKTTTTAGSGSGLPPGFKAAGLPVVEGSTPFVLEDVLLIRYSSHGGDVVNSSFLDKIEKATNIDVQWRVVYSADFREQKAMMLASGDLPQVIFGETGWTYDDIVNNSEYFLSLENLIAQYMPNLTGIFGKDQSFKASATYLDGHIYALPGRLPGRPQAANVYAINKVWLDKLGLGVPTTVDELHTALRTFVTSDPNGNGKADEIGWYTMAGQNATDFDFTLTSLFGVFSEWMRDPATGKVIYTPVTTQFRQGIEWVASLYADGSLFPEYYTIDQNTYYGKGAVTDPQVFGFVVDWTPDATIQGNSKDFVPITVAAPDGTIYNPWFGKNFRVNEMEITTTCKYPEVVARWADQFYTTDATVESTFGSLGVSTRKESDGSYTVLPLSATPEFDSQDYRKWKLAFADCGPKYWPDTAVLHMDETNGDGYKVALDTIYGGYVRPELTVDVGFAYPEELAEYAALRTDLNTYMLQTVSNWIVKGGVTDAEWNTYVKWMNDHNLAALVANYQKRADRYAASMK